MRHIWWRQEESWAGTLFLKLVRMLYWNQFVAHTVQNESWTGDLIHPTQVVELLRQ